MEHRWGEGVTGYAAEGPAELKRAYNASVPLKRSRWSGEAGVECRRGCFFLHFGHLCYEVSQMRHLVFQRRRASVFTIAASWLGAVVGMNRMGSGTGAAGEGERG